MTHPREERLPRIDELLMRVLDGEASPAQRAELMALADADARLAPLFVLRERLRAAVLEEVGEPEEVVGEVLAALSIDDGWDATSLALREALTSDATPDVSGAVLAAILAPEPPDPEGALSALFDGELSVEARLELARRLHTDRDAHQTLAEYAEIGRMVRESTQRIAGARFDGVWNGVAGAIGLDDPEAVPGWEPIGAAVREAVAENTRLAPEEAALLTGAILNALPRPEPESAPAAEPALPWWRALLRAPMLVAAMVAAAALVVVNLPGPSEIKAPTVAEVAPQNPIPTDTEGEIVIGAFNQAEVESLEVAADVMVQVVQLEDGAPVLLMIDEDAMAEGATL